MIDLITKEIRLLYYKSLKEFPFDDNYLIHCSMAFMEELQKDLEKQFAQSAIVVGSMDTIKPLHITKLHLPYLGNLTFKVDMEQGYKIEKI